MSVFGMSDPNGKHAASGSSSSSGGKVMRSITQANTGLNQLLVTLGKIEARLNSISTKAAKVGGAFGGSSNGMGGSTGIQSTGTFSTPPSGNSTSATAVMGLNYGKHGAVPFGMRGMSTVATTLGIAAFNGAVQSVTAKPDIVRSQDYMYNQIRMGVMGAPGAAQFSARQGIVGAARGGFIDSSNLDSATAAALSMGVAGGNVQRYLGMQAGFSARFAGSDLNATIGMGAAFNSAPNVNLLRAYGINTRDRFTGQANQSNGQILDQVYNRMYSGKNPTLTNINAGFVSGGSGQVTASNLGIDPDIMRRYFQAKVNGASGNALLDTLNSSKANAEGAKANNLANHWNDDRKGMEAGYKALEKFSNTMNEINHTVLGDFIGAIHRATGALGAMSGGGGVAGNIANAATTALFLRGGRGAAGAAARGAIGKGLAGGAVGLVASLGAGIGGSVGHSLGKRAGHASTGGILGSTAAGAGTGAMLGLVGGPFAEITSPVGAAIGGAVGLGSGLLKEFGGVDSKKTGTDGGTSGHLSQLFAMASGLGSGYAVTSTTSGKHANNSLHYKGDAIDLGSRPNPGDPTNLLRMDKYFASKYGGALAELIYGGPGAIRIKNGKVVSNTPNDYPASTIAEHRDHVHVGFTGGTGGGIDPSVGGGDVSGTSGPPSGVAEVFAMASAALKRSNPNANALTAGSGGAGASAATAAPGNASGVVAMGQKMAAAMGWTGQEWDALYSLWQKESGWNPSAANASSSARGIPQAMMSAHFGKNWASNPAAQHYLSDPATQIQWGLDYIKGRYGDPAKAWAHSQQYNNYSQGAWRIAKDQQANIHEGEMILPSRIAEAVRGEMSRGSSSTAAPHRGGGGNKVEINLTVKDASDAEAHRFAMRVKRILEDDGSMTTVRTT